jgi:hypothetical protein
LDDLATETQVRAFELREKQRAKASHNAQMGMLNRIEQRLINEHIGAQPRQNGQSYSVPVLDWDTVQQIALHDLETNPQKEQ